MKNEDIFNVQSAFLATTALMVGFMVIISLGAVIQWQQDSMLGKAPIPINPSSTLSQN